MDPVVAYDEARARMCDLMRSLSAEDLGDQLTSCPGWSVHDVLSHVVGIAADVARGNLQGMGSDEWSANQVAARRGRPVDELVAEWDEASGTVAELVRGAPRWAQLTLVGDLVVHELDVREATGAPQPVDSGSFALALTHFVEQLGRRTDGAGLPAVRVRAGDDELQAGQGEPAVAVEGHPLDLLRCLTGRRSRDQILTLRWEGDPDPYVPLFSSYPLPRE